LYVSTSEFKRSPIHGIDTSQLVPGGTTAENDLALTEILLAAESLVNDECEVDTLAESTATETFYTRLNRFGEVIVRPANVPIASVTGVAYRTHPSQAWTSVDLTNVDYTTKSITIRGSFGQIVINDTSLYNGAYVTPYELDQMRKMSLAVKVTYTSGYDADAIPQAVKLATISFACSLIGERGNVEIDMNGVPSVAGGSVPRMSYDAYAKKLLAPYKR
jgi:hypothetical protein